ncbi:hypothetical protein [Effusibacillus pohliae]|uniref:hypothetical protein n=1 Tax=Effusibacillus pohliae TaxID=232270 RepID=UPI00037D98B7|nr:hypothetical protein [Effusibacillus pohliae]
MHSFWGFIDTIRMEIWLALIFVFHLLLYLALRTPRGVLVALLATAVYGVLIAILKAIAKRKRQEM